MTTDAEAIRSVLLAYNEGLNTQSTSACVELYTSDGIVMPQHIPASTGTEALKKAYDGFFAMLEFSVKFTITEITVASSEWAFARTTSAGTTKVRATGSPNHEQNQELFVMQKVKGEWKIARYCFCTTNPPPQ